MDVTPPIHFWEPLRRRVVKHMVGYLPILDETGAVSSYPDSPLPLVTYISRQGGIRKLAADAHNGLIEALRGLEREGLCEVKVATMENLPFPRQIELVARSTVRSFWLSDVSFLALLLCTETVHDGLLHRQCERSAAHPIIILDIVHWVQILTSRIMADPHWCSWKWPDGNKNFACSTYVLVALPRG